MKFNLVDEKFTSDINRDIHFNKHIVIKNEFDYSEEEYEQRAELLAKSNIDNKKIFGYISITKDNKTAYCKYNKETQEFTVYTYRKDEPYTITMYRKSWRDFMGDKAIEYFDEIPLGK